MKPKITIYYLTKNLKSNNLKLTIYYLTKNIVYETNYLNK